MLNLTLNCEQFDYNANSNQDLVPYACHLQGFEDTNECVECMVMDDFNRPSRTFRPREMANTHQQQIRNPDIICDACGGKGHPASQCWPLAKELLLTNFIIRIVTLFSQ